MTFKDFKQEWGYVYDAYSDIGQCFYNLHIIDNDFYSRDYHYGIHRKVMDTVSAYTSGKNWRT
jgi:hypothetical protein